MEENIQPTVQYTDDNIRHLSDMEHVRTRPGMYIGRLGDGQLPEDGIYVLLKEVIDNSIDEFKMNAGKRIEVDIDDRLRVSVRDYGRGIPQGKLVEAVSVLNTGGKYDSKAFKKSVGLYNNMEDSAFQKTPMMRVSRTDSRGHFIIRGVAPGSYRIYALKDADGDYCYAQKSEMIAFNHQTITPIFKPDVRQDTTWLDTLHIASITDVHYTHYLPDDICLRAFTGINTDRYFVKAERKEANHFTLFYTYGDEDLPKLRGPGG